MVDPSLLAEPLRRATAADAERLRLVYSVHPADRLTPVSAYERLVARGHRASLLESVDGPARLARHSFVAVDPIASLRARGGAATLRRLTDAEAGLPAERIELALPPVLALRAAQRLAACPAASAAHPDLPPFRGGWLGTFGFEAATTLEPRVPRPARDTFGFPDAAFELYRDVVAFDHARQTLTLVTAAPRGASDHARASERLEALREALSGAHVAPPEGGVRAAPRAAPGAPFRLHDAEARPSLSDSEFAALVERAQREVAAGEVFQVVLARDFQQRFSGDPFTLYRVLRMVNPAPHMFFHATDEATLIGASPERLVLVHRGRIEVNPIAGTRPRGADDDEDEALAAALRRDPKERAEHDMLVDLARNDAGRFARPGSVVVREHAVLRRFPRVMHLVSRVEAELAPGRDALDAFSAAFPAGTVSGAPKVRALQLLGELEGTARGAYGGAFGYLDVAGDLDLAIVLRSIVCQAGLAHVQAGAGVVFASDPESEARETRHKASASLEALALAATAAFSGAESTGVSGAMGAVSSAPATPRAEVRA